MRIVECLQQSEEWERLRRRPTASCFGEFVTPARGDYSSSATAYAAVVVAKKLGVYVEPPPSFWMEWGMEHEPNARLAYETMTGTSVRQVGFILPDDTDAYGGSPDGLVGDDGLIEIKCPAPETLIAYHASGFMPAKYRPQVQGLLLISGRAWCDFFAFHPMLTPFLVRVPADLEYQERIQRCLAQLLEEIGVIEARVHRQNHRIVSLGQSHDNVRWQDE